MLQLRFTSTPKNLMRQMNISIQNELRKITKKTNFFLKKIALW